MSLREGLEWVLRACTLSPHLVPTPCRKRKMGRQKRKRPDQSSSSSSAPVLPVLPTGIDRYRLVTTTAPQRWRGHSCLRGAARAGRNACHTLPRSIAAASRDGVALPALARLCGNFPGHSTPSDPGRPPSTPVEAGCRRCRHFADNRSLRLPASTLPPATALLPLLTATAYCY